MRSLLRLRQKVWLHPYSSHSCKMSFLPAASSCSPLLTLILPNMDSHLQANTERLQASRFAGFTYLAQKFALALNFHPSSRSPLAAFLFS